MKGSEGFAGNDDGRPGARTRGAGGHHIRVVTVVAVALVGAACSSKATVATRTRPPAPTRVETIRAVNVSCRRFVAGAAVLKPTQSTLAEQRTFATARLALVADAKKSLESAPIAQSMAPLVQRVAQQLGEVDALYRRAETEPDPRTLFDQAQSILGQVAGSLYTAGATDCVANLPDSPATPAPADAGELLPRRPVATVSVGPIGADDNRIVADDRAVWVGLKNMGAMARIDPSTNTTIATIPLGQAPSGMPQIVDGHPWVSTLDEVVRIDPATNAIDRRIRRSELGFGNSQVVVTADSIMACNNNNTLVTVDSASGAVRHATFLPTGCDNVVVDRDRVWVLGDENRLRRVDPVTGADLTPPIAAHGGFESLQVGGGAVWNFGDGQVIKIDSGTGKVLGTATRSGIDFIQPCFGSGALWVANEPQQRVIRVDAATMKVSELAAGSGANAIGCSTGSIWVANSNESTVSRFDVSDLG